MNKNPFPGSEITSILVCHDVQLSKSFYVDKLGAELYREYGGDSVVLRFLGHWLLLVAPGGPTEDKPETHFASPPDPYLVSQAFTLRVQDCKESYEILKERGVTFVTPPYRRGQETRCFFRDPDGHLWEISEWRG